MKSWGQVQNYIQHHNLPFRVLRFNMSTQGRLVKSISNTSDEVIAYTVKDAAKICRASVRNVDIPPDPENMNDNRAKWAHNAVETFGLLTGECFTNFYGDDRTSILTQNIGDLLANVGHLCDREGIDLQSILRTAAMHYDEETDNKGVQFTESN